MAGSIKWAYSDFLNFVSSHVATYKAKINNTEVYKLVQTDFDSYHNVANQLRFYCVADKAFATENELLNYFNK